MRRAAEHGDPRGQSNLAVLYAQGQGVPKDENEAAKWMRKAADQGLAAGQFGLASMYAHGSGVSQSTAEAVKWYRKAADQGDPAAMNNLALVLATSSDEKIRNPEEAVKLAEKAVEIDADNASYLDTLAATYYQAHQPQKAAEAERRALKLKPDNPSYRKALEKYEAASRQSDTNRPGNREFAYDNPAGGDHEAESLSQGQIAAFNTCHSCARVFRSGDVGAGEGQNRYSGSSGRPESFFF